MTFSAFQQSRQSKHLYFSDKKVCAIQKRERKKRKEVKRNKAMVFRRLFKGNFGEKWVVDKYKLLYWMHY